jgi:hypothetical protein
LLSFSNLLVFLFLDDSHGVTGRGARKGWIDFVLEIKHTLYVNCYFALCALSVRSYA